MRISIWSGALVTFAGLSTWLLGVWPFDGPDVPAVEQTTELAAAETANADTAIRLMREACERFASIRDYRCTYLRDEHIDGTLHENHLHLKVRHEPFSVSMEWLAPKNKKGRVSCFVTGQNDGKMLVKEPVVRALPPIRVHLDPEESIKRKESRHKITEAGLLNAMERCCKRWENDRVRGQTQVTVQDAELKIVLPEHTIDRPSQCLTLTRPTAAEDRQHYDFYRTRIYFDKDTKLPIRFETYAWPEGAGDADGRLMERYTYLDMRTNLDLKDADFQ